MRGVRRVRGGEGRCSSIGRFGRRKSNGGAVGERSRVCDVGSGGVLYMFRPTGQETFLVKGVYISPLAKRATWQMGCPSD
jgi:hypothetical protein